MGKIAKRLSCVVIGLALMLPAWTASAQDKAKAAHHEALAKAARAKAQWSVVVAEYTQAYKHDKQAKYLFNIGLASDFAGKKQAALEAFRAYVANAPNGKHVVTARAKIKELEEAIAASRSAALKATIQKHLASAKRYRDGGKHDAAAFEYQKLYELTKNTEYLFEVAESYRKAGAKVQAIKTYKAYIAADATAKFSITAQNRIKELEKPAATKEPVPKATVPKSALAPDPAPTATITKKKKKKNKMLWLIAGAAVIAAGVAADTIPESGSNGSFDGMDIVPVGLYGVGITALVIGVF